MTLLDQASIIRERAYAPYSKFKVGAAIRAASGTVYTGVNVENAAYPEGTCAEAGAIAAMIAGGDRKIEEVAIIADCDEPLPPCGGCRQKLVEFADGAARVTMATVSGRVQTVTLADLLPGAFGTSHLER